MFIWLDQLEDVPRADWEGLVWSSPRPNPFLGPDFLIPWRRRFIPDSELRIGVWRMQGQLLGALFTYRRQDTVYELLGGQAVADRLDGLVAPGREAEFWQELVHGQGLVLPNVTQGSPLLALLPQLFPDATIEQTDVAPFLELPLDEAAYLSGLNPKQRHELQRKTRRAHRLQPGLAMRTDADLDTFFELHRRSRADKCRFMDDTTEGFFRDFARALSACGALRLSSLWAAGTPLASMFQFRYGPIMYLYNSGYDPAYRDLAPGLICLRGCLRAAIGEGCAEYDFLRGPERYKYDLGGRDRAVYRVTL